jgi:hypothetical protein
LETNAQAIAPPLDIHREMSLNRHRSVMKRRFVVLRTMVCSVVLAGTAAFFAPLAFAGDLTSTEIRDELVGRSIVWWENGGWLNGYLVLAPDGSAEISVDHPQRQGDKGRWTLRGGELCTEWDEIRSGVQKCYSIQRGADGRFVTSGGNVFEIREAGV